MEFCGRIEKLLPITEGVSKSGNAWKKQEFVFEYFEHDTDRWTDKVLLSVMNDGIDKYDLHEGEEVRIGFAHGVREYDGRYFNDVRLYKLEKLTTDKQEAKPAEPAPPAEKKPSSPPINPRTGETEKTDEDDLPF